MDSRSIANQKIALRAEIAKSRSWRTSTNQETESLTRNLIGLVESLGAELITGFVSVKNEPSTSPFLKWARQNNRQVLLPVSREDGLLDWRYITDRLAPGMFNIPEPTGASLSPLELNRVELMIIPAAAVDRRGQRLGWGKGYFDRAIGSMASPPPVFAVVFPEEILDSLPSTPADVPVDGVVTSEFIQRFS